MIYAPGGRAARVGRPPSRSRLLVLQFGEIDFMKGRARAATRVHSTRPGVFPPLVPILSRAHQVPSVAGGVPATRTRACLITSLRGRCKMSASR